MTHSITKKSLKTNTLIYKGLSAIVFTSLLSGCFHDDDDPAPLQAKVNFVLASVDGGSCALLDPYSNMTTIAGPVTTSDSVAIFEDVAADTGLAMLECSGGTYEDEASGAEMTPGVLRSYVNITSSEFTATVSPLTEVVARLIEYYELDHAEHAKISENVAFAFGLKDIDITTVVPLDTNKEVMDGSPSGDYGLVLAALSQMQDDFEWDTAEEIIEELFVGMANNGLFTNDDIRENYFYALENMFYNPRIDPSLGSDEALDKFFYGVSKAPLASQVEYVDADHPDSDNLEANYTINAFEPATFDLVGTHLTLHMSATLAGEECRLRDVQPLTETNNESQFSIMYAECPAQAVGEVDFQVFDHDGRLENTTTMTVVEPDSDAVAIANSGKGVTKRSKDANNPSTQATATGSSFVLGTITGQAPLINASTGPAHNYNSASLVTFPIEGVTVQLVDAANEVITTTTTTAGGNYQFTNAPDNTSVSVVVLAEIKKARTTPSVGAEYNFSVRDNTSTTSPKTIYKVASPFFTTSFLSIQDVVAKVGFLDSGQAISDTARESAPFAILTSIKTAADALETLDANVSIPELNIYWSGNNIAVNGDKNLGQIITSHYSGGGLAPGLYILGKADVDTDEFDKGVIGHEFGHFLQDRLSYSDNPGGTHVSIGRYKDASLAYGEGYGTAIGGLLSGSQYYCDVSGNNQMGGFCNDLGNKDLAGSVKGFYSEAAIYTFMYAIGNIPGKGIGAFFAAVTKMKSEMHSATIFAFLHHYLAANPDVTAQVNALMAEHNIKTSDPFGVLPSGAPADPALAATLNKGSSTTGADDLETLYIELPLIAASKPSSTEPPVLLTPDAPSFCVNRNLAGSHNQNGLGMRKRFTFTSNFDGYVLMRAQNHLGETVNPQNSYFEMREEGGIPVKNYSYNGVNYTDYHGLMQVKNGKKYSLTHKYWKPETVLEGSECGFKVTLAASFY